LIVPAFHADLFERRAPWVVSGFSSAAAAVVVWSTPLDLQSLVEYVRLDRKHVKEQEVLFSKEGRTGLISVASYRKGRVNLYNDGLNEATIHLDDPHSGTLVESMLGLLPYLLHERPERAFVIGLGGGVTMRALSHAGVASIRVAELEPVVFEALTTVVGARNAGLEHPGVEVEFEDARHLLLVDDRRYDIIASQPSHPWRAGAANLFTEEFFGLSSRRLGANGIHAQWLNLFRMDVSTLEAILRSFVSQFPHAVSFVYRQDLLLLGSNAPLRFEPERIRERMQRKPVKRTFERIGYRSPYQVLALFALSRRDMVQAIGEGPKSTDTNILPEVRLARLDGNARGDEAPIPFLRRHASFDVLDYLSPTDRVEWIEKTAFLLKKPGRYVTTPERVVERLASIDPGRGRELRRALARRGR
jgi:spermidine synthase